MPNKKIGDFDPVVTLDGSELVELQTAGPASKRCTTGEIAALGSTPLPITAQGDLIVGDAAGAPVRLPIGAEGQVASVVAGAVGWSDPPAGGSASPMTQYGSLIVGGDAVGAPAELLAGGNEQALLIKGSFPTWAYIPPVVITIEVCGENEILTVGTAVARVRTHCSINFSWARAYVSAASTSGDVKFNLNATNVGYLYTGLLIGYPGLASNKSNGGFDNNPIPDFTEITVDVIQAGTGVKGAKIMLLGWRSSYG